MKTIRFTLPNNTYEQIIHLQKKWSNEEKNPYEIADVIKVCVGTIWDCEMSSLNKTLTNSSET